LEDETVATEKKSDTKKELTAAEYQAARIAAKIAAKAKAAAEAKK